MESALFDERTQCAGLLLGLGLIRIQHQYNRTGGCGNF
jgi:hypothetical protein